MQSFLALACLGHFFAYKAGLRRRNTIYSRFLKGRLSYFSKVYRLSEGRQAAT